MTRGGTSLIEAAATEVANGESEIRVFLSQELSSTGVEGGSGGGETETSASFVDRNAAGEFGSHEDEESQIEKGEDSDQGNVDPQGSQTARWIRLDGRLLQQWVRGSDTYRRRKQTMNQAAKKIPIALESWPGASA